MIGLLSNNNQSWHDYFLFLNFKIMLREIFFHINSVIVILFWEIHLFTSSLRVGGLDSYQSHVCASVVKQLTSVSKKNIPTNISEAQG